MSSVQPPESERIPDAAPRHTPLWRLLGGWLLGLEAWLRSHGGRRLRIGIGAFWALVGLAGAFLLVGPVINRPLTLDDITGSASTATETWIAREFAADYRIDRDADGRLVAHVDERISALFPADVDEAGIERVLAVEYQGHELAPGEFTATLDGRPLDVETTRTPDRLTVTLDSGARLEGDHVFELSYELRDLAYESTDEADGAPIDLLEWDVFGPDWGHAIAGLDVSVSLPDDVDGELLRAPRGTLAWTIVSGGEWLEPEDDAPPGRVVYRLENDQRIPPNAQAWFTMRFEPGTFAMPEPSTWFWVQTFGPLAPLAVLLVTLLFALAARAVAWGDARGRPWYVSQSEPPEGLSPGEAAQLLRAARTRELSATLDASLSRRDARLEVGRAARRAGRLGDLPRALAGYLADPARKGQLTRGFRRIPRGFVRDHFLAAPLALTLVQWGIVRQLSYQAKLAVVWWPVAFVLVSTLIAIVIVAIALRARPLTRKGALARQHLLGIRAYADATLLLERGPLADRLLPYAVLMAPAREAGARVLPLVESALGEPLPATGWRTRDFLSGPQLLLRLLALLALGAVFLPLTLLHNPYDRSADDYVTHYDAPPSTLYTEIASFEARAELSRGDDGRARLEVTETIGLQFEEGGWRVPQFARQWLASVDGHDLGLSIDSVRLDGEAVPHTIEPDLDTLLLVTELREVLVGEHELEVRYTVADAAYAPADGVAPGGGVDRVRWVGLLEDWQYFDQWPFEDAVEPLTLEITIPDELAEGATAAGWITLDAQPDQAVRDWQPTVVPFGDVDGFAEATVETTTRAPGGGTTTHRLELREEGDDGSHGYPFELRVGDTGVALDVPAGTFTGPDASELRAGQLEASIPKIIALSVPALAILLGLIVVFLRAARGPSIGEPGPARDVARWLVPALTLGSLILMGWTTGDMVPDHPDLAPILLTTGAALVVAVVAWIATRGPKKAAPAGGVSSARRPARRPSARRGPRPDRPRRRRGSS